MTKRLGSVEPNTSESCNHYLLLGLKVSGLCVEQRQNANDGSCDCPDHPQGVKLKKHLSSWICSWSSPDVLNSLVDKPHPCYRVCAPPVISSLMGNPDAIRSRLCEAFLSNTSAAGHKQWLGETTRCGGDQSNPMLHRKRQRLLRDSLTYSPDSEIA